MRAIQWGVGQGGFHTQEIEYTAYRKTHTLRFIYDCGTSAGAKHLQKSIKEYAASLKSGDVIDVFYISHWDADHCGGINRLGEALQARGVKVAQVVAPPLSQLQALRLLAYSDGSAAWRRFVADPREAIEDYFGEDCDFRTMEPDSFADDLVPQRTAGSPIQPTSNGMGRAIISTRGSLVWEVIPYLHPAALVHWKTNDEPASGWHIDNGIVRIPRADRRRLRSASDGEFLDDAVNASSVMLYSGAAKHPRGGWLGTGDANLSDNTGGRGSLRSLVDFYSVDRLRRVAVVNAPHHGSKHSSGRLFWHHFCDVLAVFNASGFSYRDENGIAHPHAEVMHAVRSQGHVPYTTSTRARSLTITNTVP